jgi:glycosyltransferase involved in cell wall biosynthesis
MRWGRTPCSGVLAAEPCAPCTVASHGVPQPIALVATPVARAAARFLSTSRKEIATAVRMPELVELRNRCALEFLGLAGRILTPAEWTRELLIANGLPPDRVQLIRHGLPLTEAASARPERSGGGRLRVAFFGRLDPAKGPHLLIEAIERDTLLDVEIVIFGIAQEQAYEPYVKALRRRTANNPRVEVRPAIARSAMIRTMREFDVIAVPSLVLETGPLVVLEAFAAGVPVVGSKLGGIAELVSDGVNGLLLEPEPAAWAAALRQLAQQRDVLKQLRMGIQRPRTMSEVADEVIAAYRLLTQ